MSRLDSASTPQLSRGDNLLCELEHLALSLCASYSRLPDVSPPFEARTLVWNGECYVYVSGWDKLRRRRLLEVFKNGSETVLEVVLAFLYPPPFRQLFPIDYELLYSDDPWGDQKRNCTTLHRPLSELERHS